MRGSGKYVCVQGGFYSEPSDDNNKKKDNKSVFHIKKEIVIEEKDLAIFFRRNDEFCRMPVIKLTNTMRKPTELI